MSNFMTLVRFELKKIMKRKTAIVTLVIMMLVMTFMASAELIFNLGTGNSGYEVMSEYRKHSLTLSGRLVDDSLLKEMQESCSKGEAIENRNDMKRPYGDIYIFVTNIVGADEVFSVDADTLYEAREAYIENMWDSYYLTEDEKEYWREKASEIEVPFTYEYIYGSSKTMVEFYTCSVLILLFIVVALSAVFSDEYSKGMDKLIMSTRLGKGQTYFAKIVSGAIFAFVGSLLIILSGAIPTLVLYGADGMNAAVQLYIEVSPFPMTIGGVILAYLLIYLVAAVLFAVLTMFLSQVLKNSIASMGVMIAFLLVMMCISVPDNWRVLAQIFNLLPANVLAVWSLYDCRLVPFFGGYLTNLQFAPIAYALLIVIIVFIGKIVQHKREGVRTIK